MKKFNIRLTGGTRITKWAKTPAEALQQAEEDYPNQVTGIEDQSPFNTIEIPPTNERKIKNETP